MIYQTTNLPIVMRFSDGIPDFSHLEASLRFGKDELKHWTKDDVSIIDNMIVLPLSQAETKDFPVGIAILESKMLTDGSVIMLKTERIAIAPHCDKTLMGDVDLASEDVEASAVIDAEIKANVLIVGGGGDVTKEAIIRALGFTPASDGASYTKQESDSKYLTEHQSLDGYAKTEDVPTKTSELTNDSGFLTEHQSLEGLATNDDLNKVDSRLSESIIQKLDKPIEAPEVGKILKVKSVNEDGSFVCEWADGGSGGGISDVKINNVSVVTDGVANIPIAAKSTLGAVQNHPSYTSIDINANGQMLITPISDTIINNRTTYGNRYRALTMERMDYGIMASLTDEFSKSLWTAEKQTAAQIRLGIYPMSEEGYGYGR